VKEFGLKRKHAGASQTIRSYETIKNVLNDSMARISSNAEEGYQLSSRGKDAEKLA